MALKFGDRVKEMASSSGLADFTLAGAVAGFQPFSSTLTADGDAAWYCAVNGSEWEIGLGTRSAASVIARPAIPLESSNANAKVNFSAPPVVFCTIPASQLTVLSGPAFSASLSANVSVPLGLNKVIPPTSNYDTHGVYATATGRFQPTTPGYYKVGASITWNSTFNGNMKIYKNGANYRNGMFVSGVCHTVDADVYLNGTTDYVELYANNQSAGAVTASGAAGDSALFGHFLRA